MTSKHKTWIQIIIISATMNWLKSHRHRRQIEDVDSTVRSVPFSSLSLRSPSSPIDSYVLFLSCQMIINVVAEYRLIAVMGMWRKKSAHRHLGIIEHRTHLVILRGRWRWSCLSSCHFGLLLMILPTELNTHNNDTSP